MENKFKLLDKVVYEYVDFNKPYETESISVGGSGSPCYIPNSKVIGIVKRIETTKVEEYIFTPDYDESEGVSDFYITKYYITGYNEPLTEHQLNYA